MITFSPIPLTPNSGIRLDDSFVNALSWFSRTPNHKYEVIAIDCGIKYNIIRQLNLKECNVTVVPHNTTAEEIMAFQPDGLF